MRTLKIIALSSLFVFATASLAMACDGKKAETASAKTAACCASKAAVQTASAEGSCASKAAVQTAGAGCSAQAHDADMAKVAQAISVETVRMPSGTLAVFYNGSTEASTEFLQASAAKGCEGFACPLAKGMAADATVTTEMAKTEHGVMILVSAKDAETLDKYEAQYAMATTPSDAASE